MKQPNANKRREGTLGIKALIAAGAVAATVAGWALLPANDPQPASAAPTDPGDGLTELGVPGVTDPGPSTGPTTIQPTSPQTTLPQVTTPRGFTRQPFTRSHSSR
jgi:hypothetical protein